tara:strand:+ start:867 stop:1016 length:150 start_codon:yes stop_codon:yes gene_type:complete
MTSDPALWRFMGMGMIMRFMTGFSDAAILLPDAPVWQMGVIMMVGIDGD